MKSRSASPSVATIVLGWNHCDDSAECIHSILDDGYPAQVWFVDNGSTDGSPVLLQRQFPAISIIDLGENRGLVGGYNAGIEAALAAGVDYICVFNNDVVIQPGTLQALVNEACIRAKAGILVPKIVLYSDDQVIWSAGARARRFPPGIVQRGLGSTVNDKQYMQTQPVEYATSCSWMMSAKMVRAIGLFDPRYSFYYSDYDYCKRATLNDWQIMYIPSGVVKHKVSLSTQKGSMPTRWWRNMGEAEARFYHQYGNRAQFVLHIGWIMVRAILQQNARHIPAYFQGLRNATRI